MCSVQCFACTALSHVLVSSCQTWSHSVDAHAFQALPENVAMSSRSVLVENAGSISLNSKLYNVLFKSLQSVFGGLIDRIGDTKNSSITIKVRVHHKMTFLLYMLQAHNHLCFSGS